MDAAVRFYVDENFPFPVVEALRALGCDVLTSLEAGNANRSVPDAEVLAFATEGDRVLLTLNLIDVHLIGQLPSSFRGNQRLKNYRYRHTFSA